MGGRQMEDFVFFDDRNEKIKSPLKGLSDNNKCINGSGKHKNTAYHFECIYPAKKEKVKGK